MGILSLAQGEPHFVGSDPERVGCGRVLGTEVVQGPPVAAGERDAAAVAAAGVLVEGNPVAEVERGVGADPEPFCVIS